MAERDGTRPVDEPGDLGELVVDLVRAGQRLAEHVADHPPAELARLGDDPLGVVAAIATQLGVQWERSREDLLAFARTRMSGDYSVDTFGFDPEFTEQFFLPMLRPLVEKWFRVEVRGLDRLPRDGSALLVANHAGALPLDALVLHSVVHDAIGRHPRVLAADLVFSTPFSHDFARRIGATVACQPDATRLLETGELVSVFPEGFKGLGKPYADRYRLRRFGRGGFVATAMRTRSPIVPVSIVGSEEIYPMITGAPALARAFGLPYLPVTPFFPWLGVLGMIPLPSKWIIEFGEPLPGDAFDPADADDPSTVFETTDRVRELVQSRLHVLLAERGNPFT
ncbi:1-acyl-sn-glycerol-3-phosphate acyltransferase [Naumannella cuiyingiana]|uniref:1-acyl-sn-glycerol-3-phosphate acyltransferase n=1 Tax=Naumannella cuiyingiana TaxID=1347891 RepID=A0A7Z0DA00_9ACTN|nr:lysophospholipid acyltransferase family protein [Naumannella cuiyingiana]NYI71491.1 1-acyl-sn-glycerol-3-phosphate acyltransferase [Naumannella cuiyingiana]